MIYVESNIIKDNKTYLQVRIHTACCKRVFIVLVDNESMLDVENQTELLPGMKQSIKLAYDLFKRNSKRD